LQPFGPQDVAGACTEDLYEQLNRLNANLREGILKDMRVEDEALKPLIDTCRLDKWYQSALDLAKQDSADEVDETAIENKKMPDIAEKLASIERQIMEKEQRGAEKALHSRGKIFDTSMGKFRTSTHHRG
jgi:nuclear pore complex protein Nup133